MAIQETDYALERALAEATGLDPAKFIPEEQLDTRRDGWLSCVGCGEDGPYRMFFDQPWCATCVREGQPWTSDVAMDEWMNRKGETSGSH